MCQQGGVPAGGAENPIFSGPIFWPIFPGLDPGPAQGLTWASLGLDPGQPRPAQVSPGQKTGQKMVSWQIEVAAFGRHPKGGARASRERLLLALYLAKKWYFNDVLMVPGLG